MNKEAMWHIEEWYYDYKDIRCIIKKWQWYESNYIYNTYIVLWKKQNKELFDKYILEPYEYKVIESSPIRYDYKYEELDIPFNWWITFYERLFDQNWECAAIKIWNDYNHIWNWLETFLKIQKDLEETIDSFYPVKDI
jgi:hypothetical protein